MPTEPLLMICTNESCWRFEVVRTVPRTEVTDGVYVKQSYVCACGHTMWPVPRRG